MRASTRSAKELCEQLASDTDVLAQKMSDLLSLRKFVADAEIVAASHGSIPSAPLMDLGGPAAGGRSGRLPYRTVQ